jgi:iron complex outermembrane receptor protein
MNLLNSFAFCALFFPAFLAAQDRSADSVSQLQTVSIKGYETGRAALQLPASVSLVRQQDLQRYANINLVPVLSSIPGVRMEERSPGSYRLSIRGSLLRSPFGIRNIKVYQDDFILTDAGGNTYLNLLDFNAVGSVEIIRGPASSLYGTGTGGAVQVGAPVVQVPDNRKRQLGLQLTAGSYGQFSEALRWQEKGKKLQWQLNQGHFQSNGYRENSRMRRDALQWNGGMQTGKRNRIDGLFLFSNLNYRTPGGLTQAQAEANPRQARPATATLPGAAEQQAGIMNTSVLAGLSDRFRFSEHWTWTSAVTGMFTDFENPFITNYETRREWNLGIRSKLEYQGMLGSMPFKWTSGLEWQSGYYTIDSTGNRGGAPSGPVVQDRVLARQQFAFTQFEWEPFRNFIVQAGVSINDFRYTLERTQGNPQTGKVLLDFNAVWAPRFAILYQFLDGLSAFASVSRGFSPPSIAEVRPSAGGFNTDLQAEKGWSREFGLKASVWRGRLQGTISAFNFDLEDAIVRRTDASGAEFFINAGGTKQRGIETSLEALLLPLEKSGWFNQLRIWGSLTLNDFHFDEYKTGSNDFSGNALTGVPDKGFVGGADLTLFRTLHFMGSFQYTDPIPLNDANDAYAQAWRLWTLRAEWRPKLFARDFTFFAGIENIGDMPYSLGNDLNAFGRRYFNPAAERNYFGGLRVRF